MNRLKLGLKVGLLVGLIFGAGIITGMVTARAIERRYIAQMLTHPTALRILIERRMAARLHLNQEQRVKVDLILFHTQQELNDLRKQFGPQFQTIMSNAQSQISAELTPEQQERFKKFREEHRRLWEVDKAQ